MSKLWKAKSWEIFHHVFLKFILNLYVVKFIIFLCTFGKVYFFFYFSLQMHRCALISQAVTDGVECLSTEPPIYLPC